MNRFAERMSLLVAVLAIAGCGGSTSHSVTPPPDHLACGSATAISPGNACCSDGQQRPDCTLTVSHTGYWELPCAAPLGTTCAGPRIEVFQLASSGVLLAIYTTGTFHAMTGEVKVTLDGVEVGTSRALLPPGTVNAPLNLGTVASGTHTIVLQYSSTDGGVPSSWGGFLDLFLKF